MTKMTLSGAIASKNKAVQATTETAPAAGPAAGNPPAGGTPADPAAAAGTPADPAAAAGDDDGDGDPDAGPAAGNPAADAPPETPQPGAAATPAAASPAAAKTVGSKTVADFRAAFGHEAGSVFFVDGIAFEDACVAHMATQAEILKALQTENTELKATAARLGREVLGEADPVITGGKESKADPTSVNRIGQGAAEYAAVLNEKLKR